MMKWADKRNIFLLHFSFWLLFFLFRVFDYSSDIPTKMAIKLIISQHTFSVVGAYLHYFFLLPLLFQKRKQAVYILGIIVLLALCVFGRFWLESTFISGIFQTNYYDEWTFARAASMVWNLASFIVFISLIKFTVDRFVLEGQKRELENEKLTAELNYLKAQINPHFLFNTLHNLNYLSQIKSDQATEVVLKLSNIMRYMIYDSNKEKVPLAKEISYIHDYLDLEAIRLNKSFNLKFDVSRVDEQLEIVPLILIPFVENAFKHGISDQQENNWINIFLKSDKRSLELKVENSRMEEHIQQEEASGFGLNNLRKRLELSYPKKHKLYLQESDEKFSVHLILELS